MSDAGRTRDICESADVGRRPPTQYRAVLNRLPVDRGKPIGSELAVADGEPIPFRGWLEFLTLFSELLDAIEPGRSVEHDHASLRWGHLLWHSCHGAG